MLFLCLTLFPSPFQPVAGKYPTEPVSPLGACEASSLAGMICFHAQAKRQHCYTCGIDHRPSASGVWGLMLYILHHVTHRPAILVTNSAYMNDPYMLLAGDNKSLSFGQSVSRLICGLQACFFGTMVSNEVCIRSIIGLKVSVSILKPSLWFWTLEQSHSAVMLSMLLDRKEMPWKVLCSAVILQSLPPPRRAAWPTLFQEKSQQRLVITHLRVYQAMCLDTGY